MKILFLEEVGIFELLVLQKVYEQFIHVSIAQIKECDGNCVKTALLHFTNNEYNTFNQGMESVDGVFSVFKFIIPVNTDSSQMNQFSLVSPSKIVIAITLVVPHKCIFSCII